MIRIMYFSKYANWYDRDVFCLRIESVDGIQFFIQYNMLSRSEPGEEIEIANNEIIKMFLNFIKSEHQRSHKHRS